MANYDVELKKRIRQINARITNVEKIYGRESSIYKRIISTIEKAGGKTRFTYNMFNGDLRSLSMAENALRTVENSQYLTKEGRKMIGDKARETFSMHNSSYSDTTLTKMFDVFKNSSFLSRIFEYIGSSDIVVDEIMNSLEEDGSETSAEEMASKLDYFATHMEEYGSNTEEIFEGLMNML